MQKLAIGAICLGILMLLYFAGMFVSFWMLLRSHTAFHDTYYVSPHWLGSAVFVSIAVGLIAWGIWRLRTIRRG